MLPLILSYDSIMLRKYYEGTARIINEATEIGRLLGVIDAANLQRPRTELRRRNRIATIRSSLAIEGNTLTEEQITDLIANKRVVGPAREILEVQNAIAVYDRLEQYDAFSEASYLAAHATLMKGLVDDAGRYRTRGVGIFKGEVVAHMAPPAWNVDNLMKELFEYLRDDEDNLIIKSCVFHYEMEFIHPFMDGNGRMGRLWQTVILARHNPVFTYLPIEREIKNSQEDYYRVLALADRSGMSTSFVEYLLEKIRISLSQLIDAQRTNYTDTERLTYFTETTQLHHFTRKDYLAVFKHISTATASRDLRKGVSLGLFEQQGTGRLTSYRMKEAP